MACKLCVNLEPDFSVERMGGENFAVIDAEIETICVTDDEVKAQLIMKALNAFCLPLGFCGACKGQEKSGYVCPKCGFDDGGDEATHDCNNS